MTWKMNLQSVAHSITNNYLMNLEGMPEIVLYGSVGWEYGYVVKPISDIDITVFVTDKDKYFKESYDKHAPVVDWPLGMFFMKLRTHKENIPHKKEIDILRNVYGKYIISVAYIYGDKDYLKEIMKDVEGSDICDKNSAINTALRFFSCTSSLRDDPKICYLIKDKAKKIFSEKRNEFRKKISEDEHAIDMLKNMQKTDTSFDNDITIYYKNAIKLIDLATFSRCCENNIPVFYYNLKSRRKNRLWQKLSMDANDIEKAMLSPTKEQITNKINEITKVITSLEKRYADGYNSGKSLLFYKKKLNDDRKILEYNLPIDITYFFTNYISATEIIKSIDSEKGKLLEQTLLPHNPEKIRHGIDALKKFAGSHM